MNIFMLPSTIGVLEALGRNDEKNCEKINIPIFLGERVRGATPVGYDRDRHC